MQLLNILAFLSVILTFVIAKDLTRTFHGHVQRQTLLKPASRKSTTIAQDSITDNFQCLLPMRLLNVIEVQKEGFRNASKLFLQAPRLKMMRNFPLLKSSMKN